VGTQIKVLVGTRKGAFIYTSDEKRQGWEISEPILPGWSFYNMAADLRARYASEVSARPPPCWMRLPPD
jgi:hypothetical protein